MIGKVANFLYKFFKSVKLTLVLIGYLVIASILGTLIPQGMEPSFYFHKFSPFTANLILNLGLDNFFRSFIFLIPAALFFINLTVCTAYRFIKRLKVKAKLRLGPDILHLGLILLMIAGVITLFGRKEGFLLITPGESVKIPGGYELKLNSFKYEVYKDGRPKEWISKVEFGKPGALFKSYKIRVNKPLKSGQLNIFQSSYRDLSTLTLKRINSDNKKVYLMYPGNTIKVDERVYRLIRVSTDPDGLVTELDSAHSGDPQKFRGIFIVIDKNGAVKQILLKIGDRIGSYLIVDATPSIQSGLRFVVDPGFIPILIGLLLLVAGLALTFYQKIKDNKI